MDAELSDTRYHIDTDWYGRNNKSLETMAQSRMCSACRKKLGTEIEERVPVVDQKSGRVAFEMRKVRFGSNPFVVFRDCCAKQQDFIVATTPLAEAVFRLFLANANQPLTVEDIISRLEEWANYAQHGHYLNAQLVKRLLDHDRQYGIKPIVIPTAA